ncbi:prokaryotic E2 ligase family D protein [Mucilaginibacter sp. SMC90]|uniref:prokaryotic E2 ligase family D protein n=1 Tax=Mucilaginibacter sp. SMC90 TaxID=2929803 RepID=UPI001FB32E34|nr:prokaryotic E2 ligase family D protein [Mucilaginibacter sp. SMC90]UOE52548.1 prokaryotic E2 ligase family D protein [Mucilaginibacter sp. SMC90]
MTNISENFNDQYAPVKAILIYQSQLNVKDEYGYEADRNAQVYVESYDISKQGKPINAHPLSLTEMVSLSKLFQSTEELKSLYLKPKSLLPANILYLDAQTEGYAVWYTPPMETELFFIQDLGIPSGKAHIPAMVWKASKNSLNIYALKGKGKPTANSSLYHAPFFNIYENGNVCMGTVNIAIDRYTRLEDFINLWQLYFFNSYFSHTIGSHQGAKSDLVLLWQQQVASGKTFPSDQLNKHRNLTLQSIIK